VLVLVQHLRVPDLDLDVFCGLLLVLELLTEVGGVNELTSDAIGTVSVEVELLTQFSLVHRGHVYLFLEFVFSVSEGALVSVLAVSGLLPAGAELGLLLDLVVSGH